MIQDRPTVTIERQQKYPAISNDLFTTFKGYFSIRLVSRSAISRLKNIA